MLLLALALAGVAEARGLRQGLSYRTREARIPMRDGVELYTQIVAPEGLDAPCPILLRRTPYGVDPLVGGSAVGVLGPSPLFRERGYVFVRQDVRGRFRSDGEWECLRPPRADRSDPRATDETTDVHDTIEWLLANVEGNNGKVGMWGISYDAWQTTLAMADAHPALVAVSPQASPGDEFLGDDTHHYGAFRLAYTFAWVAETSARAGDADPARIDPVLGRDAYEFFLAVDSLAELDERFFGGTVDDWSDVVAHGTYDDYWRRRNVVELLDDVRPAVLNVAGWFDAEDFRGPIDIYERVERGDDEGKSFLVVGPWRHGGWNVRTGDDGQSLGDYDFGETTSEWFQEFVELPFFEHWLRGGEDPALPEVFAFETGENAWHELDRWPPAGTRTRPLYLRAGAVASFEPPGPDGGSTPFTSDPHDPVPYTEHGPVFPEPGYMVEDQRFLDGRDDVLSFTTAPLEQDLVLAGRALVRLHASTTGTDADWIVKLVDVYPEDTDERSPATGRSLAGAELLVCGDVLRAKFRESLSEPSPLEPGKVTELVFELPDRLHRFRAGHRLLVQVHSTWFPLYDRNPQTFTDAYRATAADLVPATHTVHHAAGAASRIELPVLED